MGTTSKGLQLQLAGVLKWSLDGDEYILRFLSCQNQEGAGGNQSIWWPLGDFRKVVRSIPTKTRERCQSATIADLETGDIIGRSDLTDEQLESLTDDQADGLIVLPNETTFEILYHDKEDYRSLAAVMAAALRERQESWRSARMQLWFQPATWAIWGMKSDGVGGFFVPGMLRGVSLYGYQAEGVMRMLYQEEIPFWGVRGGLLCDEMGLGKTMQALALIALTKQNRERTAGMSAGKEGSDGSNRMTLVVCRLSALDVWKNEAVKFFGDSIIVRVLHGDDKHEHVDPSNLTGVDVCVTTYESIRCASDSSRRGGESASKKRKRGLMHETIWERILLDEGHAIVNHNSKSAKAVTSLEAKYRWVLSGTPYRNSARDLFSLLTFLKFNGVPNLTRWNRAFVRMEALVEYEKGLEEAKDPPKFNWNEMSYHDREMIEAWLGDLIIRRTKEDIARISEEHKLPRIDHKEIVVELDETLDAMHLLIYRHINKIVSDFVIKLMDSQEWHFASVHGGVMLLRRICDSPWLLTMGTPLPAPIQSSQASKMMYLTKEAVLQSLTADMRKWLCDGIKGPPGCGSAKMRALRNVLESLPSTEKVLIFSQWTGALDIVGELLQIMSIEFVRMDGSMNRKRRADAVESFRRDPEVRAFTLVYGVGSEGLTLVEASTVILLDWWFCPPVMDQAIARSHRTGQTREVQVVSIHIADSVEVRVRDIANRKRQQAQGLLESARSASASIADATSRLGTSLSTMKLDATAVAYLLDIYPNSGGKFRT